MNVFDVIKRNLENECFKIFENGFRYEVVGYSVALTILDKVAKEYNNGWIACSERLPSIEECHKNDNRFIVTDGNRSYQRIFDYQKQVFCEPMYMCTFNTFIDNCVTHWQPLPERFKEGEDNE